MGKKGKNTASAAADAAFLEDAVAAVSLEESPRLGLLQTLFQIQKMLLTGMPESKSLMEAAGPIPKEERSKFKKTVMALRVAKTLEATEKALAPARQTLQAYPLHAPILAKEVKAAMGDCKDDGSYEFPIRRGARPPSPPRPLSLARARTPSTAALALSWQG